MESKKEQDQTPPDKEKDTGLNLEETPPPKMGAGEELPPGEEEEPTPGPDTEQPGEEKIPDSVKELMVKKGFKSLADLVESFKNQETKITELSKGERLTRLMSPVNVPPRPGAIDKKTIVRPGLEKDPYQMSKEEFNEYLQKVEDYFNTVQSESTKDQEWHNKYMETVRIISEDPEKFNRLRPIMSDLYNRYPGHGLRDYMVEAERLEKDYKSKQKESVLNEIGLDVEDIPKLKSVLSKVRVPHVSGTTGAKTGGEEKLTEQQKAEAKLIDDIIKAERPSG